MLPRFEGTLLRDAIRDEIKTRLDATADFPTYRITSRYLPRVNRSNLDDLTISVYLADTDANYFASGREGDEDDHTIEIAFQQAVPGLPTDDKGFADFDGVDDTVFLDNFLAIVKHVKDFWRPTDGDGVTGELRNKTLAGCRFTKLVHSPVFEPVSLVRVGVMGVVIAVTYRFGH